MGTGSLPVTFTVNSILDISPPNTPTGLVAFVYSNSQVQLSWAASSDNVGVTQYKIYAQDPMPPCPPGFACIQVMPPERVISLYGTPPTTSYVDSGLTSPGIYSYSVAACDAAGNCSSRSSAVNVSISTSPSPYLSPLPFP